MSEVIRRHISASPQVATLLELCNRFDIRYVLAGSVAAMVHGVDLDPGDLDIIPELDAENLFRTVDLLSDIEAEPEGFGYWTVREDGRKKWIVEPLTQEGLDGWHPDPRDIDSLDHLYLTKYGNFDVVPSLVGTYDELKPNATTRIFEGVETTVAPVDFLIERLQSASRARDQARLQALIALQDRS